MDATPPHPVVGESLPPLVRVTGFDNWNRYAAVNDEFVSIHMDDEAGRAAGFPTAFGMGNLQWSYLHVLLRNWMGPTGKIRRIDCQFRSPNTKGMTVSTLGTVREVTSVPEGTEVTVDIWTQDDAGNKLAPGSAVVLLPS